MPDSYNKIFVRQLGLAALIGLAWALLWELPSSETGFFFDLPWGLVLGFFWGFVGILIVGLIAALVWVIYRSIQSTEGTLGDSISADLDQLGSSSVMESIYDYVDTLNRSAIAWAIVWALKVAFIWGLAGGLIWGLDLDNAGIRLLVIIVVSAGGSIAIVGLYNVVDDLAGVLGEGYSWMETPLSSLRATWDSWGVPARLGMSEIATWGFGGAVAWALACLLAAAGLGTGGIGITIVLALLAFLAAIAGGIVGTQLKASLEIA